MKRRDKEGNKVEVDCPGIIKNYNEHMGYVDVHGQNMKYNSTSSKSKRWWKCIFFWLFDCACYNAYLIYCNTGMGKRSEKMEYRSWLIQLSDELMGPKSHRARGKKRSKLSKANFNAEELSHMPHWSRKQKMCSHCGKTKTTIKCKDCEIPICKYCYAEVAPHLC